MMVTVAWTWASRRSNGHSVTQQSVQDNNTRYTDDGNNRTIMADTIASKAGGFTANLRYERGDGWSTTNLTREGKGRKRAFGDATHNIEILFHWRRRDRRGSLQSAMCKASEGGRVAMWREWKGGEREGQEQKMWALP
jgi:hypothetical protein